LVPLALALFLLNLVTNNHITSDLCAITTIIPTQTATNLSEEREGRESGRGWQK